MADGLRPRGFLIDFVRDHIFHKLVPLCRRVAGFSSMLAASSQDTIKGIVMLAFYSLGLGIPFVISALLLDRLKGTFDFIKRHYRIINIVSGILLVLVGLSMMTGMFGRLLALLTPA